jgi:conjugative relaxase-like TrwC/TraI family protein
VLTVAKVTRSSAAGYADYLNGKTKASELGDYYLKDGELTEAPGRWVQGAGQFGLDPERPASAEQLSALLMVRRPDDGEELRRVGGSGEAVAALDATFSAPKSVSAVWALAGSELRARIEAAHETAIDRALTYAVRQVPMLRRRVSQDAVLHEKAAGVVATSWRHSTARAVGQQVPDPQFHSHVLLHAAVRRDGRLVAIDSRAWLVHQREVGAAYRTELARELIGLGFEIRRGTGRGGRYFEVGGIPEELLDRWSSRRHQVQAAIHQRLDQQERSLQALVAVGRPGASEAAEQLGLLHRFGQLAPREERMMATATRATKAPVTVKDLDTEWRRTGLVVGVSIERIEVLRRLPHPLEAAAAEEVLEGLTEFDATFPARDARAVALERSAGAPIQAALDQLRDLRQRDEILVLADGTGTTRDHRARERAVVRIVERLSAAKIEPLPASAAAAEVDKLDRELAAAGGVLSSEQRQAIRLGCGKHRLVVIEGQAGTGKSTTLTGIARAHQACGRQIIVTSTAALAAQRLAIELTANGVACTAHSTAGLHAAINSGRVNLTAATTVIHDEAALASTREQLQLLSAIERSGARLIAVGDPRQNQPVGASGLWGQIEHAARGAAAHVELTINQRARDPEDRRDQARFRDGEVELAIRSYAARERIHIEHEQQRAEDRALEAAHTDRAHGKSTLVIAQTSNEHLDQLNARAQAIRRQHGELGRDTLELPGRPYGLSAGDHTQIRHTIHHPEHGQLRNGTSATVAQINPRGRELELQLADGTRLKLTQQQIAEADLRLAYVQHPFPAQGQTVETTHLIIAEHTTREGSYVALTRARQETHIYVSQPDDLEPDVDELHALAERLSRSEPDLASIHVPLAHEQLVLNASEATRASGHGREPELNPRGGKEQARRAVAGRRSSQADQPIGQPEQKTRDAIRLQAGPGQLEGFAADPARPPEADEQPSTRRWPRRRRREGKEHGADRSHCDRLPGWEP